MNARVPLRECCSVRCSVIVSDPSSLVIARYFSRALIMALHFRNAPGALRVPVAADEAAGFSGLRTAMFIEVGSQNDSDSTHFEAGSVLGAFAHFSRKLRSCQ